MNTGVANETQVRPLGQAPAGRWHHCRHVALGPPVSTHASGPAQSASDPQDAPFVPDPAG